MDILYSDSFNAPNGSLSGRTLDNALGGSGSINWSVANGSWVINGNKAEGAGFAACAVVNSASIRGIKAKIRTATTNNASGLLANTASDSTGPGVILYLRFSNNALVLRQLNTGDIYGTDVDEAVVSVTNDTEYELQLLQVGNRYTGMLRSTAGVVLGIVSFDWGSSPTSNTHWGVTTYQGETIFADDIVFYSEDIPTGTRLSSDNFNSPDTSSIDGRTLNNALGGSETKAWVSLTGTPMAILSNRAYAGAQQVAALVNGGTGDSRAKVLFRWTASSMYEAIVFGKVTNVRYGPGIAAYLASNSVLRIRELDSGDRYGTDRASKTIYTLSKDIDYYLELTTVGSVATATVYAADGVSVIDTLSYDFGGTSFVNTYWGFSNYEGNGCQFDNFTLDSLAAGGPPEIEVTDFYASGPDLGIDYNYTSSGSSPQIKVYLEKDGNPVTPEPTTSSLTGTFFVSNPGPGVYSLVSLEITDSYGTDNDGPWPTPVEIIGLGEMEIEGEVDVTLGSISITATATVQGGINGEVNETLGNLTVISEAVINTQITGTLSKTLKNATLNSKGYVGEVPPPPSTGYTIGGPYLTLNISLTVT